MITAEPDITRLLSRLKTLGLIRQQRDRRDRRVLWTQISPAGLDLLAQMDPIVERTPKELIGHLSEKELAELIRLVELARRQCSGKQSGVSCSGKTGPGQCDETAA
jgi:DNA-binding MarR family transcriptional regulator